MNEHWVQIPVQRGFDTVAPIYEIVQGKGYIAGSYAAFMGTPNETPILPNDVDVFATSADNASAMLGKLLQLPRVNWIEHRSDHVHLVSRQDDLDIQVIEPDPAWTNFPDDLLANFDLDICRAVLISPEHVVCDTNVGLRKGKVLRVNDPLRTFKRLVKYAARGVEFNDHEVLKVLRAFREMSQERADEMIQRAAAALQPQTVDEIDSGFFSDEDWFEGE